MGLIERSSLRSLSGLMRAQANKGEGTSEFGPRIDRFKNDEISDILRIDQSYF